MVPRSSDECFVHPKLLGPLRKARSRGSMLVLHLPGPPEGPDLQIEAQKQNCAKTQQPSCKVPEEMRKSEKQHGRRDQYGWSNDVEQDPRPVPEPQEILWMTLTIMRVESIPRARAGLNVRTANRASPSLSHGLCLYSQTLTLKPRRG